MKNIKYVAGRNKKMTVREQENRKNAWKDKNINRWGDERMKEERVKLKQEGTDERTKGHLEGNRIDDKERDRESYQVTVISLGNWPSVYSTE